MTREGQPVAGTAPALSVVIPAYNEARRIVEPLGRIDRYLRATGDHSEIVVVDDGSTDDTIGVVQRLAAGLSSPVRVIESRPNRGKGHVVRLGMLAATGRVILTTDADLSTPIEEMERLLAAIEGGAQLAIGSRRIPGAAVEVHQPALREAMGRVFTALTNTFLVSGSDVTCGFKAFTHDAARAIFRRVTLEDWSYDAEVLFLAYRLGFEVREVPVRWRDVEGTKVRRGRDALLALAGLVRIRMNALCGRYG